MSEKSPSGIICRSSRLSWVSVLATSPDCNVRPVVLLVEDDFSLLDMFRRTLERAGFDVITATHGVTALSLFRENAIDLVITDIVLPHMDGFTLIRKLRDEAPDVPVIAISGMDNSQHFRDSASKCGANASLAKPLNRQHLVDLARRMVGPALQTNSAR